MDSNKIIESIKSASQVLFRKYGYHKTSVNEIAAKAHVAKATIYKYFESKELILNAIIMDYLQKHVNDLAVNLDQNATEEQIAEVALKTSRLSYTACNEFIGWDFIRESANAQEFLKMLSNELEVMLMDIFLKVTKAEIDTDRANSIRFLVTACKSIVFSFAFTSVSDADVKKNFIKLRKDILPYLIKGAKN